MNVLAGCASVAAVRTLALSVGGPAWASSSSEEGASEAEFEQQVAVDPNNGAQRSAVPVEGEGLKLNTQPGDQIRIEGGTVTWLDSAGGVVATIGVSSDQGEDAPFGVGGVATPIAGAITGAACEAAGGALVTAVSC